MAGAQGEARRAAQLWAAAQTLQEGKSIPRDTDWLAEADVRISTVRSGLGEEASMRGRVMRFEEAVAYAKEEATSG